LEQPIIVSAISESTVKIVDNLFII